MLVVDQAQSGYAESERDVQGIRGRVPLSGRLDGYGHAVAARVVGRSVLREERAEQLRIREGQGRPETKGETMKTCNVVPGCDEPAIVMGTVDVILSDRSEETFQVNACEYHAKDGSAERRMEAWQAWSALPAKGER
jgi:hypothetical protein